MRFTVEQKRAMKRDPLKYAKSLPRNELEATIKELDKRYYAESNSFLTDEQYDLMADYFYGAAKRPVGTSSRTKAKTKLPVPMGTLTKFRVLPESTQQKFLSVRELIAMDKEDGIAVQLLYRNGVPVGAYTRYDFKTGVDVSHIVKALKIPQKISIKGDVSIRGELTCTKAQFQKLFAKDFATSRNFVGGLLNRKEVSQSLRKLKFVALEIMNSGTPLLSQLKLLDQNGFDVVPYVVMKNPTYEKIEKLHNERKKEAGNDIDGIVIAHNVPYKNSTNPDHALAFKINSLETAQRLVVKDVVWEESRNGRWQPRVEIEPTIIGGVKVAYFTGHNYYYIQHGYKKDFEKNPPYPPRPLNKGAVIMAVRSGDVIPFIMSVEKGAKKASVPPGEFEVVGVHAKPVESGKSDIRLIKELTYFFSTLKVEGLKQGVVTQLVDAGYTKIKDFYTLTEADLLELERFGERSAKQLIAALKKSREDLTFVNAAVGSGAFGEGIGEKRLEAIAEAYPTIMEEDWSIRELESKISEIKGFKKLAGVVAQNLDNFRKFCRRNKIKLVMAKPVEKAGSKMAGQSILFTSVRDDEVKHWIISQGGKIASTVKSATMLLIKDGASNNKTAEAEKLGTPIMTLDAFREKHRI